MRRRDIARRDSQQLRRSTVGVLGIAFLVISAAAPLTAMAGGAPIAMLLGNGPGIPAAYVVVSVILLIFSVGYTAMARHHTSTGAFYSFVARGLRQPAGGAAAVIALLGYNAMQIGLYGLFGAAAAGFFSDGTRDRHPVVGVRVPRYGDHRGGRLPARRPLGEGVGDLGQPRVPDCAHPGRGDPAMALASFAVVVFFARRRDLDSNVLRTTVAPIVGGVAMTAVAIYAASQFGLLIGNPESPLRWILPALIVVAAIAGIIAAVSLRSRSPELYAQMGRHRDIELLPGA